MKKLMQITKNRYTIKEKRDANLILGDTEMDFNKMPTLNV